MVYLSIFQRSIDDRNKIVLSSDNKTEVHGGGTVYTVVTSPQDIPVQTST